MREVNDVKTEAPTKRVWIFSIECSSAEEAKKWHEKVKKTMRSNQQSNALTGGVSEKVLTLRKTSSIKTTASAAEYAIYATLHGFPEGDVKVS